MRSAVPDEKPARAIQALQRLRSRSQLANVATLHAGFRPLECPTSALMATNYFALQHDLSEVIGDEIVVAAAPGPQAEVCLLLVSAAQQDLAFGHKETGFARFPLSRAKGSYSATFVRFDGRLRQRTVIPNVTCAFPFTQPMPNDEVLIVGGRCHFRNGDPEKNAAVFDRDGRLLREFILGDGIEDIQTTKDGLIWVSYFDEGIFGNYGWTEPIGAAGLVCFDTTGRMLWDFTPVGNGNPMADCYALNVTDDAVWACYYTDFPVVRIDSQHNVREWTNTVRGARAMAVDTQRIVLWGGYGSKRARCVAQEFGDRDLTNATELFLQFPKGINPAEIHVRGRGNALYLLAGKQWYRWQME